METEIMSKRERPNVIVFFTDQQRWDTTGLHGNPMGLTPNFDRLAVEGTHVYNCSTCQPVCGPARSSLQTGLYASNTGCPTNRDVPNPGLKSLAHYFGDAGYNTGYIGKWHLSDRREAVPEDQRMGYQYWLAADALEATSNSYATKVFDNNNNPVRLPGYRVDALTDAAIRYIDKNNNEAEPFFLFLSYIEPHFQNHLDSYPAPIGYQEMCQRNLWVPPDLMSLSGSTFGHLAGYYGMCKRLDEALGRIFDTLVSLGLEEETIILFTSDHGCHFKTRNSEYKRSGHESSIRIPTFLYGTELTGGGRLSQQVSLVDMPATLLDAAGLSVPPVMDGRSIMPLVRREGGDWPQEALIQISEAECGRALRTERWKYGVVAPDGDRRAAHAEKYEEAYLYDLHADPYELNNLIGKKRHKIVCEDLRERLISRMVEAGEPKPEIAPCSCTGTKTGPHNVDPKELDSASPYESTRIIPSEIEPR